MLLRSRIACFWVVSLICCRSAFCQPIDFEHANLSFYRDKSGTKQRVLNQEHWNFRRDQILQGMQLAMGSFPEERVKEYSIKKMAQSKLGESVNVTTVQLSVTENSNVVADLYVPNGKKGKEKRPAILALHPTGPPGKRIIGGKSPRKNRQYANELAQRGYVVIAPDYPSFGDLAAHDFENDGFSSGTMQGILNHMRCVDYLESLEFVDKDRIGVIGHSLGGHNSIFVAAFDQRLKAIVTSCGWTPFHDYYQGKIAGWTSSRYMPLLKTQYGLDPNKVPFDFYELIAALAPRPFYSNSPLHDSNFEVTGVKKAIPKIKRIYSLFDAEDRVTAVYPKCQHDFPTEIREESYRFLDNALRHQPTAKVGFAGELPRIQPLDPEEALRSFNNRDLQLVAHEPIVHDPIAMSFDEDKKLFVIEMKDYSEQDKESLGRVRILEDRNADGFFEQSQVFAAGLSWPTAIICYDGGVFVAAAPDIWYLKDSDDDGQADIRKKVITGFGRNNVQGLVNCLRWGLDNRIHGATSSSGGLVHKVGADPKTGINLRGGDFSFDPRSLDIRRETGGAQHGMCFDDVGNKYVCSNSDHAQAILFEERYLARNPYFRGVQSRKSIAVDGGQAPVFRASPVEPWRVVRTRLRVAGRVPGPVEGGGTAAGYFTGSTGITIYRGDAGSVKKGTAIIGDVGSNIVHRKRVIRSGLDLSAVRIDKQTELITSTDNWFRPVQFGHGPDGCLYILDMYREVIEHPKSLPPMIKQHLDLTEGRDRGRIYRLGTPKLSRSVDLRSTMTSAELVPFLNHPNGWHRETAARLIYEKQDETCLPDLRAARVNEFNATGNIHVLWAIAGLGQLKLDDLVVATQDANPEVRRHAILLAEKTNPSWLAEPNFKKLERDPNIQVRLQLAFSIGELPAEERFSTLFRLMQRSQGHPLMTTAIMSSANGLQVRMLEKLAAPVATNAKCRKLFLASLVEQIAKRNQPKETQVVTQLILDLIASNHQDTALNLLVAIDRISKPLAWKTLSSQKVQQWYAKRRTQALAIAIDPERAAGQRAKAISELTLDPEPGTIKKLLGLVSIEQPLEVQLAAIRVLGRNQSADIANEFVKKRGRVGRLATELLTQQLLSKVSWTRLFLQTAKASDFAPGQLDLLAKSSDSEIKELARKLQAKSNTPEFAQLMSNYRRSLDLLGDATRGKTIFEKSCSRCHRAAGIGFEIGPNLATMKTRGKNSILTNILAPNQEVNPAYTNYLVETTDGRSFSGMIANETSTTIRLQKEKQETIEIAKSDVEAIKNTGLSLMPTGLHKEITVEDMADLLEFLMTAK